MIGTLNDLLSLIKEFLTGLGIENKYVQLITGGLAFLFILIIVGKQVVSIISYFISRRRKRLLAKDLHPFYSSKEVENATKYYVNTKFQNVPPSEDEEPGRSYIAAARQPLIPLFLKKAFRNDSDDNKYYLVLADSGMGKTTFMINLYLSYKYKRNWFWQKSKYDIKLFPMGHPKTVERIKNMPSEEKENCILLLDAFDEDNDAVLNYEARLKEILNLVWEFREIVITCRTQFFPSSKNEPTETGKFRFGPEAGQHHFQKIYVSVFSEGDIKRYLKKRFKSFLFFKNSNYLKALGIVLKSPNLMMRPMLLSHVNDLVKVKKKMKYGFQIYEALIEQWLERESNKAGIRKKYGANYKQLLYQFSKALARDLYKNRGNRNNKLSLKVNEIIENPNGLQLKDIEGNNIEIDKYDQGSRSLLNRNAVGEYKFSHKSILEYFLALEVFNNTEFRRNFFFNSDLDTAKRFFLEMLRFSDNPLKNNKELKLNNLGFSSEEIEEFSSKEYLPNSIEAIMSTLFKSTLNESAKLISFLGALISIINLIVTTSYKPKEGFDLKNNYFIIAIVLMVLISLIYSLVRYYKVRTELTQDENESLEEEASR